MCRVSNADESLNLSFAHRDAKDLAARLESLAGESGFRNVHARVYVDGEVTREAIREAREFLSNSTIHDTLVLFVAGHGVYEMGDQATYYFLTHEADLDDLPKEVRRSLTVHLVETLDDVVALAFRGKKGGTASGTSGKGSAKKAKTRRPKPPQDEAPARA